MPTATQKYLTVSGLCRQAKVHRAVILRLTAAGRIAADAYVEIGGVDQPLFLPVRSTDVVRQLLPADATDRSEAA